MEQSFFFFPAISQQDPSNIHSTQQAALRDRFATNLRSKREQGIPMKRPCLSFLAILSIQPVHVRACLITVPRRRRQAVFPLFDHERGLALKDMNLRWSMNASLLSFIYGRNSSRFERMLSPRRLSSPASLLEWSHMLHYPLIIWSEFVGGVVPSAPPLTLVTDGNQCHVWAMQVSQNGIEGWQNYFMSELVIPSPLVHDIVWALTIGRRVQRLYGYFIDAFQRKARWQFWYWRANHRIRRWRNRYGRNRCNR